MPLFKSAPVFAKTSSAIQHGPKCGVRNYLFDYRRKLPSRREGPHWRQSVHSQHSCPPRRPPGAEGIGPTRKTGFGGAAGEFSPERPFALAFAVDAADGQAVALLPHEAGNGVQIQRLGNSRLELFHGDGAHDRVVGAQIERCDKEPHPGCGGVAF